MNVVKTVQFELLRIIQRMHLDVLDFNGNMTIDAGDAVMSLIDYAPRSLRKLMVRDGPETRMFKWENVDGILEDFKWVMSNHEGRHESPTCPAVF